MQFSTKDDGFRTKIDGFCTETMDFTLKMMNFTLKTIDSVLKTIDFVLNYDGIHTQTMGFILNNDGFTGRLEAALAPFSPTFHMGKLCTLCPEVWRERFESDDRLEKFNRLVKQHDPSGTFANEYTSKWLS